MSNQNKKIEWFVNDRFGMFIHWGLYAIPARGEWMRSQYRVTNEQYQKYFEEFDPVDYNPRDWAKLAKEAGMKYAVMTVKHHDGFCLFDSKLTDYKATNTKANRDLTREYVEAFRAEGLKVGLYYSLIDWHHEDFPHFNDSIHPCRGKEEYTDEGRDFDRYLDYMHGQVEELCKNYGKIDIFWFDFSYDNLIGEKWRATDLVRMMRKYQPDVIIDNRLEGSAVSSLLTGNPVEYAGDFVSPEQLLPPNGMFDHNGNRIPWEACVTMNNSWGYSHRDNNYKPASMIIRKLVECVSKGGNLLLNVGPNAKGCIPEKSVSILREIGAWMRNNGESIYGCGYCDIEKPDFGRVTSNGKNIYFHVTENTIGLLPILGIAKEDIKSARLLATGAQVDSVEDFRTAHYKNVFLDIGHSPILPDEIDTVIKVTLK